MERTAIVIFDHIDSQLPEDLDECLKVIDELILILCDRKATLLST